MVLGFLKTKASKIMVLFGMDWFLSVSSDVLVLLCFVQVSLLEGLEIFAELMMILS